MANTIVAPNDNSAHVIGTPDNDVIIAGIGDNQVLTGNGGANVSFFQMAAKTIRSVTSNWGSIRSVSMIRPYRV